MTKKKDSDHLPHGQGKGATVRSSFQTLAFLLGASHLVENVMQHDEKIIPSNFVRNYVTGGQFAKKRKATSDVGHLARFDTKILSAKLKPNQ